MRDQPLTGRRISVASQAPAAELAAFLLEDLGARVERRPVACATTIAALGGTPDATVLLSPYGPRGRFAGAPPHESAVAAIGGALMGQYTYAPGPAYLVVPYATVGQALLAVAAALAAELRPGGAPLPVSALQGLFAVQTGAYAYGPTPDSARWASSPRGPLATSPTSLAAAGWLFIGASTHVFMIKVLQTLGLDD